MDLINFITDHWTAIAGIAGLILTLGMIIQKMKSYVTEKQVDDAVIKALANHCPFHNDIKELKDWKTKRIEAIAQENERTHSRLDEISFNVRNICQSLNVEYIGKKNGN